MTVPPKRKPPSSSKEAFILKESQSNPANHHDINTIHTVRSSRSRSSPVYITQQQQLGGYLSHCQLEWCLIGKQLFYCSYRKCHIRERTPSAAAVFYPYIKSSILQNPIAISNTGAYWNSLFFLLSCWSGGVTSWLVTGRETCVDQIFGHEWCLVRVTSVCFIKCLYVCVLEESESMGRRPSNGLLCVLCYTYNNNCTTTPDWKRT